MSTLEKISKALAGETLTGGARAVGEAIGYVGAGGDFSDVPQVMKDAIEAQKKRLETGSQGEKDAYSALSALGLVTNPASQIGMGIDFAKALPDLVSAIPERAKAYMAGTPDPVGTIAESGLKRRLAKGGAQAEFAKANQLERAKNALALTDEIKPLTSTGAKWGLGEGKFQVTQGHKADAFDLNKATNLDLVGMGIDGSSQIISGKPHELGVEFSQTHGLDPRYRNKGYGKAIYQNMADVYGGGISHSGSTTPEARNVYKSLNAIDTGIPSGGGTRQALPTTAMKNDPAAMAAFEAKIKEYAANTPISVSPFDKLPYADLRQLDREFEYMAKENNGFLHESDISGLLRDLYDIELTGRNIPSKIDLEETLWERIPNTGHYRRVK